MSIPVTIMERSIAGNDHPYHQQSVYVNTAYEDVDEEIANGEPPSYEQVIHLNTAYNDTAVEETTRNGPPPYEHCVHINAAYESVWEQIDNNELPSYEQIVHLNIIHDNIEQQIDNTAPPPYELRALDMPTVDNINHVFEESSSVSLPPSPPPSSSSNDVNDQKCHKLFDSFFSILISKAARMFLYAIIFSLCTCCLVVGALHVRDSHCYGNAVCLIIMGSGGILSTSLLVYLKLKPNGRYADCCTLLIGFICFILLGGNLHVMFINGYSSYRYSLSDRNSPHYCNETLVLFEFWQSNAIIICIIYSCLYGCCVRYIPRLL